jgi:intracellular septation protein
MLSRRFATSLGIEFGPVTVFFVGAIAFNFLTGVLLLMAATVASLVVSLVRDRRIPLFSLIASTFVLISGAATLVTRDPYWVVIEYTISNLAFGAAMVIGYWRGTPALKPLFETMFSISDHGWTLLSLRWGLFFIATAIASELAWRAWSYDEWVYFRFVMVFTMCIFGFSQFFLARRERLSTASPWGLVQ